MVVLQRAVLSPGKEQTIVKPSDDEQSRTRFRELLPTGKHAISIIVCYCSVLDDCWVSGLGDTRIDADPASDDCPITPAERFTQ